MSADKNNSETLFATASPRGESIAAPTISLRNICKSYRLWRNGSLGMTSARGVKENFQALKNISFEVAVGESVGIIGRNGCGKSTLLQILAGIMKPSSGSGTMNGEIATLLELGTGFHPDFTGRENILLNNAILNLPRAAARERMERIEAFADIGNFMDEPIRTYSTGMLLRLGFACAIAVDPDIFIVDEALAVGDIFFQQKCYEYMRENMSEKTRVIVSHDMHAITSFCSRVLVLDSGTIVFDGPPLQGVEFYMKALHDSQAANASHNPAKTNAKAPNKITSINDAEWRPVAADSVGGAGEVLITKIEVRVNEIPFASVVKPGDVVAVRMIVDCETARSAILFGYLVRDKMGNSIFGENSALLPDGIVSMDAGQFHISLEFVWPEVQPGDYFLTLGAGEGRDPIRHRIQCWAHNVHLFAAISPGKPVHSLFNNPLRSFSFSALAGTVTEAATTTD